MSNTPEDHIHEPSGPGVSLTPAAVAGWSVEEFLTGVSQGGQHRSVTFPLLPEPEIQSRFVGSFGMNAFREAFAFAERVQSEARDSLTVESPRILDFGAGWGRMIRCLLRDFTVDQLVAVEPVDWMAADLRRWIPELEVIQSAHRPPLAIADASIDVIYAYSVFSHLPENLATEWIVEFGRILKPGGSAILTTQKRSFINYCAELAAHPEQQTSLWHEALARSFADRTEGIRAFEAGEFLYAPNGGGVELPPDVYGDSIFGPEFVRRRWSHLLELREFADDDRCAQSVVVLSRPRSVNPSARSSASTATTSSKAYPPASPSTIGHLSEAQWAEALRRSVSTPIVDGISYPTFPDPQTQHDFVGSSGELSLGEAVKLWSFARRVANDCGHPLRRSSRLLDFGVGWGRIPRPFLHDIDPENMLGVDPLESMVNLCRSSYEGIGPQFLTTPPLPRTTLADNSFDIITAYSVFSHLNEHASTLWMAEFLRVLRPGGIVVATTHGPAMIDTVQKLRNDPTLQESLWHQLLASGFGDLAQARKDLEAGAFVHAGHGGGDSLSSSFYGDSIFTDKFIVPAWSHLLDLVAYEEPSHDGLPQTVFVLQKRVPSAGAGNNVVASRNISAGRIAQLELELEAIRSSETWKLGRALTFPLRKLRKEV
jgi:ubiquinone/menaquinone biosynthesis C-methylase UbiE